jgi:hypothetical protein
VALSKNVINGGALLRFTHSDYPFGIFWPLCCLPFFYLRILITPLVSSVFFQYCLYLSRYWWPIAWLNSYGCLDCPLHKTKDRVTRTPLNTRGELRCSGRIRNSCTTSGTRRVNLVANPVISHEWGKDQCLRQVEHIRGYLWHRYSITVNQVMVVRPAIQSHVRQR